MSIQALCADMKWFDFFEGWLTVLSLLSLRLLREFLTDISDKQVVFSI